jgi:hypothetical protein
MKKHLRPWVHLTLAVLPMMVSVLAFGQASQIPTQPAVAPGVPRLVKFGGVLKDASGNLLTNTVGITFAIYSEQTGGAPLWQETQNVQFSQGRYTVFLGDSTSAGIPAELFASGQPRWLGVRPQLPGEEEQPRVLLASVPYALKAVDADTLGGLPPSAFLQANGGNSSSVVVAPGNEANSGKRGVKTPSSAVTTSGGTSGTIPVFSGSNPSTDIENSAIFQSGTGVSAMLGIGTTTPTSALNVSEPGNFAKTTGSYTYDYLTSYLNGFNPTTSGPAPMSQNSGEAVAGGVVVPSNANANGYFGVSGYVVNNSTTTQAAALYGWCAAGGSSVPNCEGLNVLSTGTANATGSRRIGAEIDVGSALGETVSSQYGVLVTGGNYGTSSPGGSVGFALSPSGVTSNSTAWKIGFLTTDKWVAQAAQFGATCASGNTCGSQSVQFNSYNGTSSPNQVYIGTTAPGDFVISQIGGRALILQNGGTIGSGNSSNTDMNGQLKFTSSKTSSSYTFTGAYTSAPICTFSPLGYAGPGVVVYIDTLTTTTLQFAASSSIASLTVDYQCSKRN